MTTLAQLQLSLKNARKEVSFLQAQLHAKSDVELQLEHASLELNEGKAKVASLEARIEELQESNASLQDAVSRVSAEALQAKKAGDGAQAELTMQTKLANGYKKKATELRRKATHLENVIKERDTEIAKLQARLEQVAGALERERSQRLMEMHQHGEALDGARAEAARVADFPKRLKQAKEEAADAVARAAQAEQQMRYERQLAETAQGELEEARAASGALRKRVGELQQHLKAKAQQLEEMKATRWRQSADVVGAPGPGSGDPGPPPPAKPASKADVKRRVERIMREDDSDRVAHTLRLAAPSLEARSVRRATVLTRIRNRGKTPEQVRDEIGGMLRRTAKEIAQSERELRNMRQDVGTAKDELDAYEAQVRDFTLKRDRAKHSKDALTRLCDAVLKSIYTRRRAHMLLQQARRQRVEYLRSLPPDPYRVPPELVKGGPLSKEKAISMIQTRVRAWLVRRELAREAMEEEAKEQARADELRAEVARYAAEEEQMGGLLAAAEQRVRERRGRLAAITERTYELSALLRQARARHRREQDALAEAEGEVASAGRQGRKVASVERDMSSAPLHSSLRAGGRRDRLSPIRDARQGSRRFRARTPNYGPEAKLEQGVGVGSRSPQRGGVREVVTPYSSASAARVESRGRRVGRAHLASGGGGAEERKVRFLESEFSRTDAATTHSAFMVAAAQSSGALSVSERSDASLTLRSVASDLWAGQGPPANGEAV